MRNATPIPVLDVSDAVFALDEIHFWLQSMLNWEWQADQATDPQYAAILRSYRTNARNFADRAMVRFATS